MDIAVLIGRILFGGFFLFGALNHFFMGRAGMVQYAGFKRVPSPTLAVVGSGVLLLVGGASILFDYRPVIGAAALVLFLLPVSVMMHDFWKVEDATQKAGEMTNFMKNMALMGAALLTLAI